MWGSKMDRKKLDEIEEEHVRMLIDNRWGIGVTFLKALKKEDDAVIHIPELSYHLHFFFSYDQDRDNLHIINL